MKEYIKEKLVEIYKTCAVDTYGQIARKNFTPSIFGDRKEEVENYCKENEGVLKFSMYGNTFGAYKAFTIEDKELLDECRKVLSTNPYYVYNMTKW